LTYAPETADDAEPPEPPASAGRRGVGCLVEIVETLVLTIVIYLLIHNFVAQPFEVEQDSMIPTINPAELVLIDKITPRFDGYRRGDIVVFDPSGDLGGGVPFIKRVIGLPGDTVRLDNGRVFVTSPGGSPVRLTEPYVVRQADGGAAPTGCKDADCTVEWVVPEGHYFVLGDNRPVSQDSRFFGPIARDQILGRAWLRYFPLDRVGIVQRPTYAGLPDAETGATSAGQRPVGWCAERLPYLSGGSWATIQASI